MSPDPSDHDRLLYRNAADDRPDRQHAVAKAVGTGVMGVAVVGVVGAVIFLATLQIDAPPGPRHYRWPLAVVFGLAAVAAGGGLAYLWGDRRRRSAAVGFLIGLLVACLVEGTCFFNP